VRTIARAVSESGDKPVVLFTSSFQTRRAKALWRVTEHR
jgi:hypothetical protein